MSLTLSPAMCALLLKPHASHRPHPDLGATGAWFLPRLQSCIRGLAGGYAWLAASVVRYAMIMLVIYAGVLGVGLKEFGKTPLGFIPQIDGGYLIVVIAASLRRVAAADQ